MESPRRFRDPLEERTPIPDLEGSSGKGTVWAGPEGRCCEELIVVEAGSQGSVSSALTRITVTYLYKVTRKCSFSCTRYNYNQVFT